MPIVCSYLRQITKFYSIISEFDKVKRNHAVNFHFSLEFSRFNLLTYVAPEKAKVNAAYYVGKLLPMQCSLTTANGCFHIIIPARRRSSSDGLSDAGLAKGQLYWLDHKGWMATKFTRLQPTWLSCVGCNASGISQTSLKAKDHPRAKKCTASDLGWLAANND